MTPDALRKLFPHCSEQFIRANADARVSVTVGREGPITIMEHGLGDGPLAKSKTEKPDPARFFVRITSYRFRLLDEDNICEKFLVDCCRYAQLLPGDDPSQARIVTTQEKVRTKEEERTEIVIERM